MAENMDHVTSISLKKRHVLVTAYIAAAREIGDDFFVRPNSFQTKEEFRTTRVFSAAREVERHLTAIIEDKLVILSGQDKAGQDVAIEVVPVSATRSDDPIDQILLTGYQRVTAKRYGPLEALFKSDFIPA